MCLPAGVFYSLLNSNSETMPHISTRLAPYTRCVVDERWHPLLNFKRSGCTVEQQIKYYKSSRIPLHKTYVHTYTYVVPKKYVPSAQVGTEVSPVAVPRVNVKMENVRRCQTKTFNKYKLPWKEKTGQKPIITITYISISSTYVCEKYKFP